MALGVLVNHWLGPRIGPVKAVFPLISVAAIVLIIAIIVALNAGNLVHLGAAVIIAVVLHNGIGLAAGYWIARLLGRDETTARTLAKDSGGRLPSWAAIRWRSRSL